MSLNAERPLRCFQSQEKHKNRNTSAETPAEDSAFCVAESSAADCTLASCIFADRPHIEAPEKLSSAFLMSSCRPTSRSGISLVPAPSAPDYSPETKLCWPVEVQGPGISPTFARMLVTIISATPEESAPSEPC